MAFYIIAFVFTLCAAGRLYQVAAQEQVQAQTPEDDQTGIEAIIDLEPIATDSANATNSAEASPAAQVDQRIRERQAEDITETGGEQKSRLAALLDENPIGPLTWHNFLQHAVRRAVVSGLPANIIVLLLLFPVIASIIAASRHVIGLRGFGIYIPAVLSVAFVNTEIVTGIIIFVAVLVAATITRTLVKKFKFPYLPRTAMLLWGVSLFILGLLMLFSQLELFELLTINIFPVLIIILLAENFMDSQLFNSQKEALKITLETLLIAIICSLIISQDAVQNFVILRPELVLVATAAINYLIGRYTGLRLLEILRFSSILGENNYEYQAGDDQSE